MDDKTKIIEENRGLERRLKELKNNEEILALLKPRHNWFRKN
jgi:hypothetical protein